MLWAERTWAELPDEGQRWFDWMVEDLSELIEGGLRETPPLDQSHFETISRQRTNE